MSALVVRTLAEWLAGNGGSLVAGTSPPALDRAVEGVARPRRFIPSTLAAIDVHEVVLTTSDAFPPHADFTLDALITFLADSQAALIVAGLPACAGATDLQPYQAADALAFPLISVPATTDLTELARQIDDMLRTQQTQLERSVRDAQAALNRSRHADPSLASLTQAMAHETGLTFVVEDEHRMLVTLALPDPTPLDETQVKNALTSYAARRAVRAATPGGLGEDIPVQRHLPGNLARAIVPLLDGATTTAYMSLLGPDAQLSHRDVALLWRVAPAFASAIANARSTSAPSRQTSADALLALLSGNPSITEFAQSVLDHHLDPNVPLVVVLAQSTRSEEQTPQWVSEQAERLGRATPAYWATAWHNAVALMLPAASATEEALHALARLLGGEMPSVVLGIGRPHVGSDGACQSLRDAEQALNYAVHAPERGIVRYADLGVLRLFLPLQGSNTLTEFYQETLAPLIQSDRHHSDALLITLEHWLAANGNLTEAARRLNLHRNTLMYRLHRIEELLGASLDDADRRLALHVALKIWHMRLPTTQ